MQHVLAEADKDQVPDVNVGVLVELAATFEIEVKEQMDMVFGLEFRVSSSRADQ